jgi:hypothetical protein
MAPFGTGQYPTLFNVAKTMDPSGNTSDIVELLQQTNAPLLDIPFVEGNLPTGHQSVIRTGIPTGIWRKWYQGVPAGKSEYAPITDVCGNLQARSEIDKKAADFNGNSKSFRLIEAMGQIEGMNQQMMTALLYGDVTLNPEQFNGLAPRYSTITDAGNAQNIIDGGGSGSDNTSIWLVCWGKYTVFGIYPKGSKAGLIHQDLGEIDCQDKNGDKYRGYGDIWDWSTGLCVKDWRYIVRIANIDVSNLTTETGAADLIKLMIKAMHRVPNLGVVQTGINEQAANGAAPILMAPNPVFYANRTVAEMLDIQSLNAGQYLLKPGNDVYGRPITSCRGIPIRTCDQILNTEGHIE